MQRYALAQLIDALAGAHAECATDRAPGWPRRRDDVSTLARLLHASHSVAARALILTAPSIR